VNSGVRAIAVKADVSDEDQVMTMFARMKQEFGTIDVLVNNAGLQQDASFENLTLKQWKQGSRRESHGAVPVCPGSRQGIQTPRSTG